MRGHTVPIIIIALLCMGAIGLISTLPSAPCRININVAQIIIENKPMHEGLITKHTTPKIEKFPVLNEEVDRIHKSNKETINIEPIPTHKKKTKPFPPLILQLKYPEMMSRIKERLN